MGSPLGPDRTSLAWSGPARPSADTKLPDAVSCLLRSIMNAMCAMRSSFGQAPKVFIPATVQGIIRMYFIFFSIRVSHGFVRFHEGVGARTAFSTWPAKFFLQSRHPLADDVLDGGFVGFNLFQVVEGNGTAILAE